MNYAIEVLKKELIKQEIALAIAQDTKNTVEIKLTRLRIEDVKRALWMITE